MCGFLSAYFSANVKLVAIEYESVTSQMFEVLKLWAFT